MKKILVVTIFTALVISSCILLKSQDDMMPPPNLKTFYMVLLKEGPNRDQDKQKTAELQRGHLNNIRKLAGVSGGFLYLTLRVRKKLKNYVLQILQSMRED